LIRIKHEMKMLQCLALKPGHEVQWFFVAAPSRGAIDHHQ
jgi:hypothetical protein